MRRVDSWLLTDKVGHGMVWGMSNKKRKTSKQRAAEIVAMMPEGMRGLPWEWRAESGGVAIRFWGMDLLVVEKLSGLVAHVWRGASSRPVTMTVGDSDRLDRVVRWAWAWWGSVVETQGRIAGQKMKDLCR